MGFIKDQGGDVYRDFVTAGVPASGPNEPAKSDIRALFSAVDLAIGAAQAGLAIVSSIADRDTFYATEANRGKLVYVNNNNGSATDPANGVYEYVAGAPRIAQSYYEGAAAVVQPLVDLAEAYANADTDADIPGADAGDRGAKFWAAKAAGAAASVSGDTADVAPPRTGPAAGASRMVVNKYTGAIVSWYKGNEFHTASGDFAAWAARGWDNLRDPSGTGTMAVVLTAGRSNGADALSFGQLWRKPAEMGDYPAGYSGPLDTYQVTRVTNPRIFSQFGNNTSQDNLVNIGTTDGQTQYGIWGTDSTGPATAPESKLRGYALRRCEQQADLRIALSQTFAEGGKSLSFLDRPTEAQIRAGAMVSQSDGTVTIPQSSAEYQMLIKGQSLAELWRYGQDQCATRFYKGARALASIRRLAWIQYGLRAQVEAVIISHGEPDNETSEYGAAFRKYVLNLRNAVREITGHQKEPLFSYTAVMLSNGYDNAGAVIPENSRFNETAARVVRMGEATQDLSWVQPGFARGFFNPNIHSDAWTQRNEGEYEADLTNAVVIQGRDRSKGLQVIDSAIIDGRVVLTTQSPFGEPLAIAQPKSTTSQMPRAGMPYGLQYDVPNGSGGWTPRALALSDVTIDDNHIFIATASPDPSHRVSINFDARATSFVTDPAFTPASTNNWYDNTPNQLNHKMLPYRRTIGGA